MMAFHHEDTPSLCDSEYEIMRRSKLLSDPSDIAWEGWCRSVERLLHDDLACASEDVDGYSLDGALEAFEAGSTPEEYAGRFVPTYEVPCGARLAALSSEQRRKGVGSYGFEAIPQRRLGQIIHQVYKGYGSARPSRRLRVMVRAFEREAILMSGGLDD